ncbi:MAG TPA: OmpA family protein [Anaeromyxobacteraceae bacterium]|nr:OmpA family protein [Anaeromyxobacteraceae bacterium]
MRITFAIALAALAAGCVSEETFRKKELEAQKYRQDWLEETGKRAQLQQKVENMQAQVDALALDVQSLREKVKADEDNLGQKQSQLTASNQRAADLQALVDELSKSKKKLEQAKAELEKRSTDYEQLAASLKGEIEAGRVEVSELRGRMAVKMKDKILFASGSATIGKEGKDSLRAVASALRAIQGKVIRVEGHTDNVPTAAGGPFPTNWELSSARALAVVRFLQEVGMDPTRLAAAGYGEFQPMAPNDTPEGRSQNRRIEIVLAPDPNAPEAPRPVASPAKT